MQEVTSALKLSTKKFDKVLLFFPNPSIIFDTMKKQDAKTLIEFIAATAIALVIGAGVMFAALTLLP